MSVAPRGGSWQADFRRGGKRYRRQFASKQEAEQWEADSVAGLLRGQMPDMGDTAGRGQASAGGLPYTMLELKQWVSRHRWSLQTGSKQAQANAGVVAEILGNATPITKVDKAAVSAMVAVLRDRGDALATINRKLSALSVMMKEAVDLGIITQAPRHKLFKETEGRIRRITAEEEGLIVAYYTLAQDVDMLDFVRIGLDTGLREKEILGLNSGNTSDPAYVKVFGDAAKSKRNRAVPATPAVVAIVARRRKENPNGPLFPFLNVDRVQRRWGAMRGKLGLLRDREFVPHVLRHEFCSRLADLGVSVQIIQALAGHSAIETTMRYIHLSPTALAGAIQSLHMVTKVDTIHPEDDVAEAPDVAGHAPHGRPSAETHTLQ